MNQPREPTAEPSPPGTEHPQRELVELFEQERERLSLMVRLRMDRRVQGRIDCWDVLQEAYLECSRRFEEYQQNPSLPLFLWVRFLTAQKLVDLHRQHLGVKMRDASREVSVFPGLMPQASSLSLAAQLVGRLTSASRAVIRAETQAHVQNALDMMDPIDREVLTMRHFEMLTNEETAKELGIKKTAASNRYVRAMMRLKAIMEG